MTLTTFSTNRSALNKLHSTVYAVSILYNVYIQRYSQWLRLLLTSSVFPSSSSLLYRSYLRRQAPDQAGVAERLYFFKLFPGTGGCRHSKQHITAPQEILPFGCPDVEALAGFRPIRACAHAPAWGCIDKNKQNNTISSEQALL